MELESSVYMALHKALPSKRQEGLGDLWGLGFMGGLWESLGLGRTSKAYPGLECPDDQGTPLESKDT